MKILIINLPRYKNNSVTREGRCEMLMYYRVDTPATLLTIASLLREKNIQVDFIDANGLNLSYKTLSDQIKNKNFDCAIFTFASLIIDYDLKICDILKKQNPNSITIGYSWYGKKFAKDILNEYHNLDILIIEDPFSVIEVLYNCLNKNENLADINGIAYKDKNKQIKINDKLDIKKKFSDLPIPAYDLLTSFKPYYVYSPLLTPYALVYAGKGCPYGCTYCNVARTKYSGKTAEQIIKELKYLKQIAKVKYIWFFDEIFTINRKRVIQICRAIIKEKLKIKWFCDSRVDLVDQELLKIMKKGGCIGISYGVESGSQKILNLMKKNITIQQAKNALFWTRKAHIPIQLNLILGYEGENKKTIKQTEAFIRSTLPEMLQITKMMALIETEFYDLALEKNWVSENLNWKKNLKSPVSKLHNYKPYELNIWEEKRRIERMLHYNPKWWLACVNSLIRNPMLISPIIGTLFKRSQTINLV